MGGRALRRMGEQQPKRGKSHVASERGIPGPTRSKSRDVTAPGNYAERPSEERLLEVLQWLERIIQKNSSKATKYQEAPEQPV